MQPSTHAEKRRFWRSHIAMAGRYSGTQERYCHSQVLSIPAFYYWKMKLSGDRAQSTALVPSPFVQVEVTPHTAMVSPRPRKPRSPTHLAIPNSPQ